jgi:hypothetical protein
VLLPVVCSSRQRRRAREEREALERRQREAEARVDETRRKLRAARRQNLALSGLALAACIAAVMAWIAWRDALVQRAAATTAAKTAEEQREAAERSRRRFYGAQAALSFIAWEKGQIGRACEPLDDSEKAAGFDRVGWEWHYVKGLCDVADMGRTVLRLCARIPSRAWQPGRGGWRFRRLAALGQADRAGDSAVPLEDRRPGGLRREAPGGRRGVRDRRGAQ